MNACESEKFMNDELENKFKETLQQQWEKQQRQIFQQQYLVDYPRSLQIHIFLNQNFSQWYAYSTSIQNDLQEYVLQNQMEVLDCFQ